MDGLTEIAVYLMLIIMILLCIICFIISKRKKMDFVVFL